MIETKIEGQQVITVAEEVKPVIDITAALRESIAQASKATKSVTKASRKSATNRKKTPAAKKASAKRQAA